MPDQRPLPFRVGSVIPGMEWPAIGNDRAAHLQSLLFQLEQSQWLPAERLRERQLVQLRALLRHALATVPHYVASLAGLDIEALDWESFTRLPLISRRELQENFDSLSSRHPPAVHGMVTMGESSGSTGMPVRFRGTAVTQLFWNALTLREHLWQQRDFSGKLAVIRYGATEEEHPDWGAPVAAVFLTGPGATFDPNVDLDRQLEWLQRTDPDYLLTHPSNLGALAELSLEQKVSLPRLRQARTFSEALRSDLRDLVHTAWDVDVADIYSSREVGVMAFQCPGKDHYHVQAESLIVEVLHPDGSVCGLGETGEVVVTSLHNFALPLIRYRIGDFAEVGDACECGRGLPVLARIHGRQRNMITLPSGQQHWPSFTGKFWREIAPVEQFQLVQHRIDDIEARYVMARDLDAAEQQQLERALQERLRFPHPIRFVRLAQIERGPSRKYEDFISLL